jgi:hypothetical protein
LKKSFKSATLALAVTACVRWRSSAAAVFLGAFLTGHPAG